MGNINDSYFEGHYKEIWRSIIPEDLTVKEVDFMLSHFGLKPGSSVLDLMSGYGRHALALAKKGVEVTAVDILEEYNQEVEMLAAKDDLPVKSIPADVVRYEPVGEFDLVICMGNSLNFFDEKDSLHILTSVAAHLKPTGKLFINTWSLTEIVAKSFKEKTWTSIGEFKCLNDSKYLFHPARIETETSIIDSNGGTETKTAVDYIFSVNEMEKILERSGLSLVEIWSIPGRKVFTVGEPRAYIIAKKA